MSKIPTDRHITYQFQLRKCGKAACGTCREGKGHGPYWYAYWREGRRLRSAYVGKVNDAQRYLLFLRFPQVIPLLHTEKEEISA